MRPSGKLIWMQEALTYSILGFRLWTVSEAGILRSLATGADWNLGLNHACCATDHVVPDEYCQCGFHAYNQLEDVKAHAALMHRSLDVDCVIGAVAASGEVQVHSNGFRAQTCEVLALSARHIQSAPGLFAAAELYGVPVLGIQELNNIKNYPGTMPAPCLPWYKPLLRGAAS